MMTRTDLFAAVDWGGTWIRAALVGEGRILHRDRVPRPGPLVDQYAAITDLVARGAERLGADPAALGVGVAGIVQRTTVRTAINLGITEETDVATPLTGACGLPTFVVNDLQATALGLAGRWPHGTTAVVSMGTGVGGAVVDEGRLITGVGGAGDFGHAVMDVDGPPCPCGGHGCLETLVSGKVLAATATHLAAGGRSALLAARAGERDLHAGDLQDAADAGEPPAAAALDRAAVVFAAGLRTVVAAIDPDRILLVGAMFAPGSAFGRRLADQWELRRPNWSSTPLIPVPDDEDAALLGAASFAASRFSGTGPQ
jgi:glucokinase